MMNFSNAIILDRIQLQKQSKDPWARHEGAEVILLLPEKQKIHFSGYRFMIPLSKIGHFSEVQLKDFAFIGAVLSVDKEKKELILQDQTAYSFKYLILLPDGSTSSHLMPALWSLVDALKIQGPQFPVKSSPKEFKRAISSNHSWEKEPLQLPYFPLPEASTFTHRFCHLYF